MPEIQLQPPPDAVREGGGAERKERALMENEKRMRRKRGGAKIDGKEIGQDMKKMKHISESVRQEKKEVKRGDATKSKGQGTQRVFMRGRRDL